MRDTSLDSPEEVRGLIRAGRAATRLGDYQAALVAYQQAVKLEPANVEAQEGLAEAQRRLGIAAQERQVEAVEYCYRHPDVETGLHCVQCNRPICARCSYPAAVGQLCPECRKGRRAVNYQVNWVVMAKAAGVAAVLGAIGVVVASFIGIWFLLFFVGAAVGEGIIRVVDRATRMKRGPAVQAAVAVGLIAGAGLMYVFRGGLISPISAVLFLVIALGTTFARLR